jgi:HEAT repeat protein
MAENEQPPADDWLARRRRLDSLLRLQAAVMIGDPSQTEAVRVLAEALSDPESDVRELAAAGLSEFGPEAQVALPELIKALQDESAVVRRRVLRAIGFIGAVASDDALPGLIAATEDDDESVALQAVATIGDLGPAAAPAIPALMSAIWTGDVRRRAVAGASMMRVGEAAVPSLVQSLSHPAAEVRAKVAHLLGQIGPAAAEARPALQALQNDRDDAVRARAAAALKAIG